MIQTAFIRAALIIAGMLIPVSCAQTNYDSRKLVFSCSDFKIVGTLQTPVNDRPNPVIIIVHGSGRGTSGYYREMRERFLSEGYATFMWDKPGYGESKGTFSEDKILTERAAILLTAVSTLSKDPDIDPKRIGVWGVSQAGFVISLALQQNANIAFMILVGAPGENSVEQTAYFVSQQALCEGFAEQQAEEVDSLVTCVLSAQSYDGYVTSGRALLDRYPIVREIDFMAGILPEDRWKSRDPGGEIFYDPMTGMESMTIPALVFFGELDKNVDPVQGSSAYRAALAKTGNAHSKVVLFPGVDHDLVPSETGCVKERNERRSWQAHPGYMDAMMHWLSEIEKAVKTIDVRSRQD